MIKNNNRKIKLCKIDDCFGDYAAKGYCRKHYDKFKYLKKWKPNENIRTQ